MPVQFGIHFQNHIPPVLKYQDHKVRDTVDDMVQPILRDFQQDNLTLVARTARRSKDCEQIEDNYLNSMEPADVEVASSERPHIDTQIFKETREQIKWKQKAEIKTFPCDLEFAIQQNGQEKKVIKFIPPEIIPNQTDYFFSKNWTSYDGRPELQKKLRDQLAQVWLDDYFEQQAVFNLFDTIPAENPGSFLPELAPTQWLQSKFEQNPFSGQFGPN